MLCCMFKSSRTSQVRHLWKARVHHETRIPEENSDEYEFKSAIHSLLKHLKEKQLETLAQSVEMHGGEETDCIYLPRNGTGNGTECGKKSFAPLLLCCKMWRWENLTSLNNLKRLPCCRVAEDPNYECCNPYHWSLRTEPDCKSTSTAWSEIEMSKFTVDHYGPPDYSDPHDVVSTETGMTPAPTWEAFSDTEEVPGYAVDNNVDSRHTSAGHMTSPRSQKGHHWCSLAYWELRERTGRLLTVFDKHLNIFQSLPHGNGFCLGALQKETDCDSIRRTRTKIGYGVVLSQEDDGVWMYNRSDYPIFVNSPTLENPRTRSLYVHKVSPGYALKIFEYARGSWLKYACDQHLMDGPSNPFAVRVSFAKGWGPHYSRQCVTSCPCWFEICLTFDPSR
ncbi:mothers against decapentaplegic homolog 6-like [Dreissena polymorpha]|uniref:Mothers against decapentaplegic homolog n=1 Tax=Dreissena polymorpha TaxID=45954 RepID=A0A9D4DDK0_DREPO|nr:mothers against decapentaplegic homolog 6-like [Dreissena polymorpha]XP_052237448.1 mothers against decapentaplegic homolog 6-like [Dreissena polymorpha]KAH3746683.1 hypothetical protein DPMN_181093 [Dreissena polymorpha]